MNRVVPILQLVVISILTSCCGGRVMAAPDDDSMETVTFAGAGDIAVCGSLGGAESTSAILDAVDGLVFTAGDNSNENGSWEQYANCFEAAWGRHRHRLRPTMGNHDTGTASGLGMNSPYYKYFGDAAGVAGKGYYAFDYGAWRIYALNSEMPSEHGADQERWLREDLVANPRRCSLAYWHVPLFSSAEWKSNAVAPFWELLHQYGAEIVINGHSHIYERHSPQDAFGNIDASRGIRQFIVGTGGAGLFHSISPNGPAASSEMLLLGHHGVLKLVLRPDEFEWSFLSRDGEGVTKTLDSGTGRCHR